MVSDSEQRVRGGDVSRVAGGAHADIAWKRSRGDTALGRHGPR